MYTTTERSGGVGKRTVLGSVCGAIGISAVILPLIGTSIAGREVLSDMDCVVEPSALVDIGSAVPGLLSETCLLYTSPSPRDRQKSRMPSSA